MNVLIINKRCSHNLGDQAIGRSIDDLFIAQGCSVVARDLTDGNASIKNIDLSYKISKNKDRDNNLFLRQLYWFIKHKRITKTISTSDKIDFAVIGGGELLQNNVSFPVALWMWVKRIKRLNKNTPIYMVAVGVTKKHSWFSKILIKKTLQNVKKIFVRDMQSMQNLKEIFGVESDVMPDVVFGYDRVFSINNKSSREGALLGITAFYRLKYYGISSDKSIYFEELLSKYQKLKSTYGIVKCFYTDNTDYATCIEFSEWAKLTHNYDVEVAKYSSLDELLELLVSTRYLESPRMHACILSMLFGTDYKPVIISPKMQSFSELYKSADINLIEIKQRVKLVIKSICSTERM